MTGAVTHWIHSSSNTHGTNHETGGIKVGSSNRNKDYAADAANSADTADMRARRQDSWVDAVVTLLATVIFGLGWVLVELERAAPPPNRYDAATSEMWIAAVATSIDARAIDARMAEADRIGRWGDTDTRWPELVRERSSR